MTTTTAGELSREVWSAGDYTVVGSRLVWMAEDLCETADLRGGHDVADIACGNGNAALAAARRGARVTGIDVVADLLASARQRATSEGLDIDFRIGDAAALDLPDAAFDVVVSCVGVQFASDHDQTARELLRITRPGGRIALASWTPVDCWAEFPAVVAEYSPPPPGAPSPMTWGTEDGLRSLFGNDVDLTLHDRTFRWRLPSAHAYADMLISTYPPLVRVAQSLDDERLQSFTDDLVELFERWNEADDGTLVLPLRYVNAIIDT